MRASTSLFPRLIRFCLFGLFVFVASATTGFASGPIYAKFGTGTGLWAGTSFNRPGWVELQSFSFSSSIELNIGSTAPGTGAGKINFEGAEFVKQVDQLTPQIFGTLASGAHLPDFVVEFQRSTGGESGPETFFRVEFKLVGFASMATQSSSGDDILTERVRIEYGSMRVTSWPVRADGSLGAPISRAWDRVQNLPEF